MNAIIEYGEPVGVVYTLPVFENRPHEVIVWPEVYYYDKKEQKASGDKEYYLHFEPESSVEQFLELLYVNLTDVQIRQINELYFYMLDNPGITYGLVKI